MSGGDIKGGWELWSQACLDLNFTFATLRLGSGYASLILNSFLSEMGLKTATLQGC